MVEKIVHRIRILHHIKRHHRAYILGGFSIFAIIQTVSFLSGIFSKASYEEAIMPEVQQEDSIDFLELEKAFMDEISGDNKENKEIYNTVFQFFGGGNEESDDPPLDGGESNDDRIPPTTTISGGVPDTRIKTDLPIELVAVDTGVGVHYTLYCTGTNTGCVPNITGTTLTVGCASNTTCPSQYVNYHSVDYSGNWEAINISPIIRIDKQGPSFIFNNGSGPECSNGSLSIIGASDAGAGLNTTPYSFNGSHWSTATSTSIPGQQPGVVTKTGYVRDALANISTSTATYTFTNTMPTANNFTGHANVGNIARTVNWKLLSNATDGACGAGDLSFNGVTNQGTKGSCSVSGDYITYTPNSGAVGNDSCEIRVRDNEGYTVTVLVNRGNLSSTIAPASSGNILLEVSVGRADQTLTLYKYFDVSDYTVDRGDGTAGTMSTYLTKTYNNTGTYYVELHNPGSRWTFSSASDPLVPQPGTTVDDVKVFYMPSLSGRFGDSASDPGNYFFRSFNARGALTSLPTGSFDTSNIIGTVGRYFFSSFNFHGALTSLPEGSFDISGITRVFDDFFSSFNHYGSLTSLPAGSFDTSSITRIENSFFASFNNGGALTSLPAGSFDTSSITRVENNFFASFNDSGALTSLPAGSFNTSNITGIVGSAFFKNFNYNGKIPKTQSGVRIKNVTSSAMTFYHWNGSNMSESVPAGSYFESYNTDTGSTGPTPTSSGNILLEVSVGTAKQTLTLNKYFDVYNYTVDRGDGTTGAFPIVGAGSFTLTKTYDNTGTYYVELHNPGSRWTFSSADNPLIPWSGTTVSDVKVFYMPSLSGRFGVSASDPGDNFFRSFNNSGAITSLPAGSFDTSSIIRARDYFFASFNSNGALTSLPEGSFNISGITYVARYFFDNFNSSGALTSLPVGSFDTSNIASINIWFFAGFNARGALTSLPTGSFDISGITNARGAFFQSFNQDGALTSLPAGSFNTSNITIPGGSFFYNFNNNGALTSLPTGSFDTSSITNVNDYFFSYFNRDGALTSLPAGSFDTSNITSVGNNFFYNFNRAGALTSLPSGSFDTSSITSVGSYFFYYFNGNGALTSLPTGSFNTSNITSVGSSFFRAFNDSGALTSLPAGSFDTSNITSVGTNFFSYFNQYGALTSLPTGSFNTSNITNVGAYFFYHFNSAGTLTSLPMGSFDTSNITNIGDYFFVAFNQNGALTSLPIGSFDTSSITSAGDNFFTDFNYYGKIPKTQSGVRIKNVTSEPLTFYHRDGANRSESVPAGAYFESYNAGVDNIPPTTTDNINSDWRKTDFPVSLNATDTGAGVHYTLYCTGTTLPPFQCSPNITGTTLTVTCPNNTTCSGIYVSYRSVDLVGNVEPTKTSPEIRIDKQGPSFTFNNRSGPECSNGYLIIINASDTGAGLHTSPYSFNGTTWSTAVSTSIPAQQPGTVTKTGYVRDALTNISTRTATYTFTDVAPTANNFTGHTSVGANTRTVNWKNLSNATEGNCGSGSLSATVSTNGTKGTCSVAGDDLSYTPNVGQFGTDSCVIGIYDNENKYVNITVFWEGIQTISNPLISFTGTTPANNASLNKNRFLTEIQLDQIENIKSFGYNFAGNAYSVYDSGLVLMYNFDRVTALGETTSIIKDMSQYNNTGTNVNNAVWTVEGKHNGAYRFDGTSSYIDAGTADSLNFGTGPFTVMLRAQTNTSGGARSLISKGGTFSNTTGWAIGYAYGPPNIYILLGTGGSRVAYNTQIRMRSGYKLIGFTRENNGDLYFIEDGTKRNISLNFPGNINNNTNLLVGKNNSYHVFSGILDEVRIYNRALSAQEIQFLYKSNLRKVATDRRLFEMLNTCLGGNNTYTYTGYVTSIYDQVASASRKIYTNIPNLFATGLSDFDFGIQQVSEVVETKTGQYNDYIEIHDMLANTGWRITVSASSQLSGQESSFSIPSSNLFFMYNSLDLLSGTLPSTLGLNTSLQNRSNIHTAPVDYFIKNTVPNDFMCDEGVFGDKPFLKLNIPAYQAPDNYVGTLYINVAP